MADDKTAVFLLLQGESSGFWANYQSRNMSNYDHNGIIHISVGEYKLMQAIKGYLVDSVTVRQEVRLVLRFHVHNIAEEHIGSNRPV